MSISKKFALGFVTDIETGGWRVDRGRESSLIRGKSESWLLLLWVDHLELQVLPWLFVPEVLIIMAQVELEEVLDREGATVAWLRELLSLSDLLLKSLLFVCEVIPFWFRINIDRKPRHVTAFDVELDENTLLLTWPSEWTTYLFVHFPIYEKGFVFLAWNWFLARDLCQLGDGETARDWDSTVVDVYAEASCLW